MLSLGGSAPSVALFTNAILREFSGHHTTTQEEHAAVIEMPGCLGLLARREDDALQFLLAAVRRDFDLSSGLWRRSDGGFVSVATLRGRCITALGRCGRPEARALFDDLRSDPVAAADFLEQENDSAVMEAAFYWYCWGSPGMLSNLVQS